MPIAVITPPASGDGQGEDDQQRAVVVNGQPLIVEAYGRDLFFAAPDTPEQVQKLSTTPGVARSATNSGANLLDGGAGNDTLSGGAGNDTYRVDSTLDVVTDNAGQGMDTIQSTVSRTLGVNTENLTLIGTAAINGTGNALTNLLVGNAGAHGYAGNDSLEGAAGADALAGGEGNDRYVGGLGADSLVDTSTTSSDVYVWGRGEGPTF